MEMTMNAFKKRQGATLKTLQELQDFVIRGQSFGVEPDAGLLAKLECAVTEAKDEKLRVALIGGFSEGKTTIAAAWLERLDKSTMKISQQESSNAVTVYEAGPNCVLIDTPGLFGFKEQFDAQANATEKYKELTRKAVSQAHLVVYVMDPTNPIKESHREELQWLFRTLNLLPRTVFVLSRFDAVADVEDEHAYQQALAIKKENVEGRLRDLIALDAAEAKALTTVAVAADPFEMGTDHWLGELEQFRALSRISLLQRATSEKVASAGGQAAVIDEARRSIVRDVLHKQLPVVERNEQLISREVQQLETMDRQLGADMDKADSEMKRVQINLRTFVNDYFTDLILQAKGLSLSTFQEFFERNIGAEGIVLNTRLQTAFDQHLRSARIEFQKMSIGIDAAVNHFNEAVRSYGKQGVDYAIKSGVINNTTVLAARDGVVSAAKVVGVDLGKFLKFKPWGATNLAKGIEGGLAAVGLVLELWDSWEQAQREKSFREGIVKMVENFEQQRKELLELVNGPQFEAHFFPEVSDLRAKVQDVHLGLKAGRERQLAFREWHERGQTIAVAFRELAAG